MHRMSGGSRCLLREMREIRRQETTDDACRWLTTGSHAPSSLRVPDSILRFRTSMQCRDAPQFLQHTKIETVSTVLMLRHQITTLADVMPAKILQQISRLTKKHAIAITRQTQTHIHPHLRALQGEWASSIVCWIGRGSHHVGRKGGIGEMQSVGSVVCLSSYACSDVVIKSGVSTS